MADCPIGGINTSVLAGLDCLCLKSLWAFAAANKRATISKQPFSYRWEKKDSQ